jgi:FMN phosphatase YigB (HAD superfamily)
VKKIFIIFTIFLLVLKVDAVFNLKDLKGKLDPQNTVFVFDMHDVVLDKMGKLGKLQLFGCHSDKAKFLTRLKSCGINLLSKSKHADIAIEKELIQEGDSSSYIDSTLALINSFTPNAETLKFINNLHDKGFKIFGCSNMGPMSLEHLKINYPDFAHIFKKCFAGFQGPTKENNFLTKKDPETYKQCLAQIVSVGVNPKTIIFVDDCPEKIKVAESSVGLIKGYRFINPNRLVQDFKCLI